MKNHSSRSALFIAVLGTALAALPVRVSAQTAATVEAPRNVVVVQPEAKISANVSGKVEARSDTTLTVGGRTISINSATTFSRNSTSIGNADVKVGYKVNVVTSDNGQVAVSVDVLSTD